MRFWCQLRLIYLCACSPTILDKSPRDTTAIFIFFCHFSGSLLKQCIIFEIFLQFYLPPPYTKLKLGKKSGYTRPTLFVGWGEGLDLCELENAPETQKCPKTFVHDCSYNAWRRRVVVCLSALASRNSNWELVSHFSIFKTISFYFILFY